jgi:hypothetical protein
LLRAVCTINVLKPFNEHVATGIRSLIEIQPKSCDIVPIIRSVQRSLATSNSTPPEQSESDWTAGACKLIPILVERDEEAVRQEFSVVASPLGYLSVIKRMRELGLTVECWRYMVPSASKDEVISSLAEMAAGGFWNPEWTENVKTLRYISDDWNWAPLFDALKLRVQDYPQPFPFDIPAVLSTCFVLLSDWPPEARDILENPARVESLVQLLSITNQIGLTEPVAFCVLPLLSSDIQIAQPNQGWPQDSPQWRSLNGRQLLQGWIQNPGSNSPLIDVLSAHCLTWLSSAAWRALSQSKPECKQLISAFLGPRIRSASPDEIETSELVDFSGYWQDVVGVETYESMLAEKAASGKLSSFLMNEEYKSDRRRLYLQSLNADANDPFRQYLIRSLSSYTSEDWLNALSSGPESIETALILRDSGFSAGVALQDALYTDFDRKVSESSPGELNLDLKDLTCLLTDEGLAIFKSRILSRFKNPSGKLTAALPNYGGPLADALAEAGIEDCYERVKQIIEAHDQGVVFWLANVFARTKPKAKVANTIRKSWKDRAESFLDEDIPEQERGALRTLISELAS